MNIPWPKTPSGDPFVNKIKLSKNYPSGQHDYLYGEAAHPMFSIIAEWIIRYQLRVIVEPGCGGAYINTLLKDRGYHDYEYYGFDACPQTTHDAVEAWKDHDNAHIWHGDWHDVELLSSNIPIDRVDCLLLMGILAYGLEAYGFHTENGSPMELMNTMVSRFTPQRVFIREVHPHQTHIAPGNELHTIDIEEFSNIAEETVEVDQPLWLGHKVLFNVAC